MGKRKRGDESTAQAADTERPTKKANNALEKPPNPSNKDDPISQSIAAKSKPKSKGFKVQKIPPKRPFPTVSRAVNASGPKSSHHEGENLICITRKTPLGRYLQRCKQILVDGKYKYLLLHALGAAIPHLTLLTTSLPLVLPFPRDQIRIDTRTYTVDCTQEIIPDDEDEDISYEIKGRSALGVLIRVGEVGVPDLFDKELGSKGASGSGNGEKEGREKSQKKKKKRKKGDDEEKEKEKGGGGAQLEGGGGDDDVGSPIDEDDDQDFEQGDEDLGEFVYEEGSQEED